MDKLISLDIIYQDDYLIAINKPAGLLVHKSNIDKHEDRNAMHMLRDHLGQWVYPVHRLDKPTSGVLLFALNEEVAALMGEQFENHKIEKTYQAIVRGYIDDEGIIDHPLKPIADFKKQKEKYKLKDAQAAITYYTCLSRVELPYAVDKYPTSRYSLVELKPKTGRKHQLRRHMKHINHPIIGDPRYGKSTHNRFFSEEFGIKRLLLAATDLSFIHPVSNVEVSVEAKVSEDFKKLKRLIF